MMVIPIHTPSWHLLRLVTAIAIAGKLTFNPMTDTLTNSKGENVRLSEPVGIDLPPHGFGISKRVTETNSRFWE